MNGECTERGTERVKARIGGMVDWVWVLLRACDRRGCTQLVREIRDGEAEIHISHRRTGS